MVNLLLSALAGLLLSGAFEPIAKWWLAPIALLVHMYAIERTDRRVLSAFVFAFTFNAFLLHWTSTYVGSTPWIILSIGLSLFYMPLALIGRWGIAAYPLIFVILEEVRNRFPFGGFGWARVAYSQADAPYAAIAARGGVISLSAMTVLLAAFVYFAAHKNVKLLFVVPLLTLLIPNNIVESNQTSVLMIQGNVPELGLDFNARAKAVFNNHVAQTKVALAENREVDFIVWPENAVDVDPYTNKDVFEELESFNKPLIIGAIIGKGEKLFNTSILWGDKTQDIYFKQHLTPFGEYLPLRSVAQKVSKYSSQITDFKAGEQNTVFDVNANKFNTLICYELINDAFVAEASNDFLVVQTNNATFGDTNQLDQQLNIARVRALESARGIAYVSTTGTTSFISPQGKILSSLDKFKPATLKSQLNATQGLTYRQSFGHLVEPLAMIVLLGLLLLRVRRGS